MHYVSPLSLLLASCCQAEWIEWHNKLETNPPQWTQPSTAPIGDTIEGIDGEPNALVYIHHGGIKVEQPLVVVPFIDGKAVEAFKEESQYPIVSENLQVIRSELQDLIRGNPSLASKFVRLAFNDCIGGCDGCVDLSYPKNYGLDHPIYALQSIVDSYVDNNISRADIWALAALAGAELSQGEERVNFDLTWFGRIDCETISQPEQCSNKEGDEVECSATKGPHRNIPDPVLSTHELLRWFEDEFGFDTFETVVLMGAHTLGRKHLYNTGYEGASTIEEFRLDNKYYTQLIEGGLELTDSLRFQGTYMEGSPFSGRWEWTKMRDDGQKVSMFPVDMALAWDFDGYLDDSGRVACLFDDAISMSDTHKDLCPRAEATLLIMKGFMDDNLTWLFHFSGILKRMLEHGYILPQVCKVPPCRLERPP